MPPVVPRKKSSAREATRSTADVAEGRTGEDEVPLEEEECQAQAAISLKKRSAKKSPIQGNLTKGKRPESFPQRGEYRRYDQSALTLSVSFLTYTLTCRRLSMSLMGLMKRR